MKQNSIYHFSIYCHVKFQVPLLCFFVFLSQIYRFIYNEIILIDQIFPSLSLWYPSLLLCHARNQRKKEKIWEYGITIYKCEHNVLFPKASTPQTERRKGNIKHIEDLPPLNKGERRKKRKIRKEKKNLRYILCFSRYESFSIMHLKRKMDNQYFIMT